jgi:hypothetical protein
MDHDDNFKTLLTTFFIEFVRAFLPKLAAFLDPISLEFLDKEVFAGLSRRKKGTTDIVVKARFKGEDAFFLVHVENQASVESGFPKRMFRYFARLHERYDLPVYPIVIFSYDTPQRLEPSEYKVVFPDKTVLDFHYTVIQLNRISWRKFVKTPNPAATALMAKMKMAPIDRPTVLRECRRLLATLKLTPERSELIWAFVEGYLQLTTAEFKRYERDVARQSPEEKEDAMPLISSIKREGIHDGQERMLVRQINRRFGTVNQEIIAKLEVLASDQLEELGEALFDFTSLADVEAWLAQH